MALLALLACSSGGIEVLDLPAGTPEEESFDLELLSVAAEERLVVSVTVSSRDLKGDDDRQLIEITVNGGTALKRSFVCGGKTSACATISGKQVMVKPTVVGEAVCGCGLSGAKPSGVKPPSSVTVDWVTWDSAAASSATMPDEKAVAHHIANVDSLGVGVNLVAGTRIAKLTLGKIKSYGCVLAVLRFIQELRGSDRFLVGFVDRKDGLCKGAGLAQIGAGCRYCGVSAVSASCLETMFATEHEVLHNLGARDRPNSKKCGVVNDPSKSKEGLMYQHLQPCAKFGVCSSTDIAMCPETRKQMAVAEPIGKWICPYP